MNLKQPHLKTTLRDSYLFVEIIRIVLNPCKEQISVKYRFQNETNLLKMPNSKNFTFPRKNVLIPNSNYQTVPILNYTNFRYTNEVCFGYITNSDYISPYWFTFFVFHLWQLPCKNYVAVFLVKSIAYKIGSSNTGLITAALFRADLFFLTNGFILFTNIVFKHTFTSDQTENTCTEISLLSMNPNTIVYSPDINPWKLAGMWKKKRCPK